MQKVLLICVMLVTGFAFQAKAQKKTWKELDDFHSVMSATFHPSEEGNLKPIKERSKEMAEKAEVLAKSEIPVAYQKEGVKESIKLLAKESKALDKMIKDKKSDEDVKKSLSALHDRFHEVMEKCNH
jgi:wyosine [tRNA(Phe)-imidazoG37] synthetase (radical SAM superfamily)